VIDTKLKAQIMQAFAEGTSPVDAVIRFKIVPDTIKTLYEEYYQSKGGMVIWGDTAQELEKQMGLAPGSLNSGKALVDALTALSDKVETARKEVLKLLEPYGWLPVEGEPMQVKHKDTGQIADMQSLCLCHGKVHCVECGKGLQ